MASRIIPAHWQTRRKMDNEKFLIEACGGQMEDIVKSEYFKPGTEPVKVSAQAPSAVPNVDVEIEVVAVVR